MAFTDAEMAVLSQLVYKNDIISNNICLPLDVILKKQKLSLLKELGPQYKDVIEGLVKKSFGYSIDLATNDKDTGFAAMAISGPNKEVTVVCRGTEDLTDWTHGNFGLIAGSGETEQHKQMENFMNKLAKNGYESYYFGGHSLGGNLAMYGAIYMAKTGKVKGVAVFNAPNFNTNFCKNHKEEIEIINDKTIHYQNEYDIVSSINEENTFGQVVICGTTDNDANPLDFDDHSLSNFDIGDGRIIPTSGTDKKTNATVIGDIATNGFTIVTLGIVGGMVGGIALAIGSAVGVILTIAAISYVYHKAKEWFFKNSKGYKQATTQPYIIINTTSMNSYANQLANLSQRAKTLDRRMNSLYWKLGIEWDTIANLGKLLKAEVVLDFAYRLDKNVAYLRNTASEFDSAEREISNMLG